KGVYSYNEGNNKLNKISFKHTFQKDLEREFQQMFEETWAGIDENFYEENFHGVDWATTKKDYQAFVPYVRLRVNIIVILNDMVGEIISSHVGFTSLVKE